ncbi:Trans-acting T-cell-specific transcription factor GATA-3 [Branchiostoma belcheri]|nr:Trans-acting T-cell-specific transcription factor GATA-3 [Branchiostoma belcheri]
MSLQSAARRAGTQCANCKTTTTTLWLARPEHLYAHTWSTVRLYGIPTPSVVPRRWSESNEGRREWLTINEWNKLPGQLVKAQTVEAFKAGLLAAQPYIFTINLRLNITCEQRRRKRVLQSSPEQNAGTLQFYHYFLMALAAEHGISVVREGTVSLHPDWYDSSGSLANLSRRSCRTGLNFESYRAEGKDLAFDFAWTKDQMTSFDDCTFDDKENIPPTSSSPPTDQLLQIARSQPTCTGSNRCRA